MFYLYLAAALFVVGAAFGFSPLWALIKKRPSRMKFVLIHGGLQLLGLVFLIIGAGKFEDAMIYVIAFLMAVTAGGGLMLFALRRAKAPIPAGMALLHPIFGVGSLVLLFIFMFK